MKSIEKIEQDYGNICNELASMRRHYQELKTQIAKIELVDLIENDNSFLVKDLTTGQNLKAEMKKYRNLHPEDLQLLRALKIKIQDHLVTEMQNERDQTFIGRPTATLFQEPLSVEKEVAKFSVQADRSRIKLDEKLRRALGLKDLEFVNKNKKEFVQMGVRVEGALHTLTQTGILLDQSLAQVQGLEQELKKTEALAKKLLEPPAEVKRSEISLMETDFNDIDESFEEKRGRKAPKDPSSPKTSPSPKTSASADSQRLPSLDPAVCSGLLNQLSQACTQASKLHQVLSLKEGEVTETSTNLVSKKMDFFEPTMEQLETLELAYAHRRQAANYEEMLAVRETSLNKLKEIKASTKGLLEGLKPGVEVEVQTDIQAVYLPGELPGVDAEQDHQDGKVVAAAEDGEEVKLAAPLVVPQERVKALSPRGPPRQPSTSPKVLSPRTGAAPEDESFLLLCQSFVNEMNKGGTRRSARMTAGGQSQLTIDAAAPEQVPLHEIKGDVQNTLNALKKLVEMVQDDQEAAEKKHKADIMKALEHTLQAVNQDPQVLMKKEAIDGIVQTFDQTLAKDDELEDSDPASARKQQSKHQARPPSSSLETDLKAKEEGILNSLSARKNKEDKLRLQTYKLENQIAQLKKQVAALETEVQVEQKKVVKERSEGVSKLKQFEQQIAFEKEMAAARRRTSEAQTEERSAADKMTSTKGLVLAFDSGTQAGGPPCASVGSQCSSARTAPKTSQTTDSFLDASQFIWPVANCVQISVPPKLRAGLVLTKDQASMEILGDTDLPQERRRLISDKELKQLEQQRTLLTQEKQEVAHLQKQLHSREETLRHLQSRLEQEQSNLSTRQQEASDRRAALQRETKDLEELKAAFDYKKKTIEAKTEELELKEKDLALKEAAYQTAEASLAESMKNLEASLAEQRAQLEHEYAQKYDTVKRQLEQEGSRNEQVRIGKDLEMQQELARLKQSQSEVELTKKQLEETSLRMMKEREEQAAQWSEFIKDREKLQKEQNQLRKKEKQLQDLDKWCNSERDKLQEEYEELLVSIDDIKKDQDTLQFKRAAIGHLIKQLRKEQAQTIQAERCLFTQGKQVDKLKMLFKGLQAQLATQDESLQNLEFSIDLLFQKIQPEEEEEEFFSAEREQIIVGRYRLNDLRKQFIEQIEAFTKSLTHLSRDQKPGSRRAHSVDPSDQVHLLRQIEQGEALEFMVYARRSNSHCHRSQRLLIEEPDFSRRNEHNSVIQTGSDAVPNFRFSRYSRDSVKLPVRPSQRSSVAAALQRSSSKRSSFQKLLSPSTFAFGQLIKQPEPEEERRSTLWPQNDEQPRFEEETKVFNPEDHLKADSQQQPGGPSMAGLSFQMLTSNFGAQPEMDKGLEEVEEAEEDSLVYTKAEKTMVDFKRLGGGSQTRQSGPDEAQKPNVDLSTFLTEQNEEPGESRWEENLFEKTQQNIPVLPADPPEDEPSRSVVIKASEDVPRPSKQSNESSLFSFQNKGDSIRYSHKKLQHFNKNFSQATKLETSLHEKEAVAYAEADEEEEEKVQQEPHLGEDPFQIKSVDPPHQLHPEPISDKKQEPDGEDLDKVALAIRQTEGTAPADESLPQEELDSLIQEQLKIEAKIREQQQRPPLDTSQNRKKKHHRGESKKKKHHRKEPKEERKAEVEPAPVVPFDRREEPSEGSPSRGDKSVIMNMTIDEFIEMQKEDLEKIGITGNLFRDVWEEYKRQGKSMQQMQHDLIEYQIMIEKQIQKVNKKKRKKEGDKKKKTDKSKHRKKISVEAPEEARSLEDPSGKPPKAKQGQASNAPRGRTMVKQPVRQSSSEIEEPLGLEELRNLTGSELRERVSRMSKEDQRRLLNFEIDQLEDSVFVEPFKLQDRTDYDKDHSLLYQDMDKSALINYREEADEPVAPVSAFDLGGDAGAGAGDDPEESKKEGSRSGEKHADEKKHKKHKKKKDKDDPERKERKRKKLAAKAEALQRQLQADLQQAEPQADSSQHSHPVARFSNSFENAPNYPVDPKAEPDMEEEVKVEMLDEEEEREFLTEQLRLRQQALAQGQQQSAFQGSLINQVQQPNLFLVFKQRESVKQESPKKVMGGPNGFFASMVEHPQVPYAAQGGQPVGGVGESQMIHEESQLENFRQTEVGGLEAFTHLKSRKSPPSSKQPPKQASASPDGPPSGERKSLKFFEQLKQRNSNRKDQQQLSSTGARVSQQKAFVVPGMADGGDEDFRMTETDAGQNLDPKTFEFN